MFEKSCADQFFSLNGVSESRSDEPNMSAATLVPKKSPSKSEFSYRFRSWPDMLPNIRGIPSVVMKQFDLES